MRIVPYLREELGDGRLPAFWYDSTSASGTYVGIQSLYYYEYTYPGLDMPNVNEDFKTRLATIDPEAIVLLCSDPTCAGGPENLRGRAVPIRFRAEPRFANGDLQVWVKIFDLARA
ncbi:MAG: hypothetical protein M3546_00335 [Actinomycetota bacterium]|nr:hypothetical protein [Actinomycetota bacterium]